MTAEATVLLVDDEVRVPSILAAGFDAYQTKPISVRALLEAVRILLDQACRENTP